MDSQPCPWSDITEARKQTPASAKVINVQIGPGDVISYMPVMMDFEHHQVHEGETYKASDAQASLGTGTVKYSFVVPVITTAIRCPHLLMTAECYGGGVRIDLFEGATFTSGSLVPIYNRNRAAGMPTSSVVIKTGITSSDGALIDSYYVGTSTSVGGTGRSLQEFVLKSNTTYRIDMVGLDAQVKAIIHFNWYEDLGV